MSEQAKSNLFAVAVLLSLVLIIMAVYNAQAVVVEGPQQFHGFAVGSGGEMQIGNLHVRGYVAAGGAVYHERDH